MVVEDEADRDVETSKEVGVLVAEVVVVVDVEILIIEMKTVHNKTIMVGNKLPSM